MGEFPIKDAGVQAEMCDRQMGENSMDWARWVYLIQGLVIQDKRNCGAHERLLFL